jgi:xanthine dehydrogenase accessory factor
MPDLIVLAADHIQRGVPCALCTVIRSNGSVPRHAGSKMLAGADGALIAGTVGGGEMESRVLAEARLAIRDGRPRLARYHLSDPASGDPGVCGGEVEVFIEPLLPAPTLLIAGAGHVGRALARLARWMGFRVAVTDDRPELCAPDAFPDADERLPGPLAEQVARFELTPHTYVALVTRGSPIDAAALPALLRSPAAYVGVIGSRRRWLTTVQALKEQGVTDAELARVHAPIGLEIGAETPEEIAVSILAEIIRTRRSRPTATPS